VVGADVGRVPLRHFAVGEGDHVGDEAQRGLRRENVGPAREVFLDDVVLHRAGELVAGGALLLGTGDVERQQPGRRGVDGHGGVHLRQGDLGEELFHVAQVIDRHADLADLALGQGVVRIVAGLGRQIEGHRQAGLAARQVLAVERVRGLGGGVPRIGADQPGPIAFTRGTRLTLTRGNAFALARRFVLRFRLLAHNALTL